MAKQRLEASQLIAQRLKKQCRKDKRPYRRVILEI